MAYDYSDLLQRTQTWAQQAYEQGWLTDETLQLLSVPEMPSFTKTQGVRPLIVAFMGGTGVGKSSLLNRLAKKAIAKAGVARPTSKEVTLFYHHEMALPSLPLKDTRIAHHHDDAQKTIVWIDMPDFDSTDAHNKTLVLQWLPHIDVLIYVVSPERYRDEKAWQLLLSQGTRHAWLFVMNQWDRGQIEQAVDFEKQLKRAGFHAPLIFKTCCESNVLENDEFNTFAQTLTSLATQKTITQLEQRGTQVRVQALQQQLQSALLQLGTKTVWETLQNYWRSNWKTTAAQLQQGFAWRVQPLAEHFAQRASDLLTTTTPLLLWDEWAQTRFEDALNALVIDAQTLKLPTAPLDSELLRLYDNAQKQVHHYVELNTRQALAQRGNVVQRFLLKIVRAMEIILPLAAMSWVGYQVVNGYVESNQNHANYLNVDFAVHSTLVCGLAWLVPFFILKKCQPSLEKSAVRGLNKGILQGLENLDDDVIAALEQFSEQQAIQLQQANALLAMCDTIIKKPVEFAPNSTLERMLMPDN